MIDPNLLLHCCNLVILLAILCTLCILAKSLWSLLSTMHYLRICNELLLYTKGVEIKEKSDEL